MKRKMKGEYSRHVKTAVKLIWSSFDRDEIRRGYSILILEAQKGDADALAFIARCFMGESYVWPQAGFKADDENASKLMQKSAMMGSATGVLCAARSANLTPSVERAMPFASFKEAFEEILGQAERGDAFCCYMVGNVYYWGDYLRVEPDYAKQFKDESDYNAWAWPIAKAWYERSFDGGLCAGWGNYCDIRESGLCDIAQDVFEKYYLMLADISPVICNNYGYYLRTEKGDSYGGLLRYVEAARRGDPQAAYNAGHIYEAGEEVDENIDLAYQLYEMAAKCGHPAGQFEVGYYLFEGFGDVEQDYAKAVEWFEKAYQNPKCSKTTRTQTAAYLGLCYQEGLGTVQDDDVAFEYLHEAGEDIDNLWESITVKVLTALGVAYAFGRGIETDIELGYQYLEDAAKLGSEEAKEYISYINSPDYEADERKKEEPATPVAPFWQNVAAMIRDAVAADLREILGRIDDERIYTVALVTDRYCCSLFLAVNTLEYLESEDEEPDDECKWHPDEWGYSDGHDSELVKLSKSLWENHNTLPGEAFFFSAMISAMAQVKGSGIFGEGTEEITFFISISDDEDAENLEDSSAMTLNSPELAAAFLNRNK
ncbi:DUF4303 domain-containing protein [Paramuribaculum intestinale]|uniref:DUF4303 domain-containing protein n=1 Tax=Paramuribaculum intestinale TaxID=2094151 RepID=UPI002731A19E|nr:DUF4303 domain-containing protein [Paramuribaculum intestinale]